MEADGKRFGDFEMDTMIGADQSEAILTVTERKTNLVMIGELPRGRDSKGLAKVLCRMLLPYKDVIRTITTDNGLEFAAHERITEMLEARCTSPTPIWHGKKDRSKTRTSSSGNTSPRGRPSRTIHPTD